VGALLRLENVNELPDIATKIGAELRNQYILGYHPSNKSHDARWRKIKIKLRAPKGLPPLSVYAKTGYYGAKPLDCASRKCSSHSELRAAFTVASVLAC